MTFDFRNAGPRFAIDSVLDAARVGYSEALVSPAQMAYCHRQFSRIQHERGDLPPEAYDLKWHGIVIRAA